MPPNLQETVDLVTSTEEIHSGKLHFCAENKKRDVDTNMGYPVGNYMFTFSNRNTKTRCEICSKLIINTPASFWCHYYNFEHISQLALVFLFLTLSR